MNLSKGQFEKLSDLFIDLAKGLFLAGFAIPFLAQQATIFESLRSVIMGIFFTYLSLKAKSLEEVTRS